MGGQSHYFFENFLQSVVASSGRGTMEDVVFFTEASLAALFSNWCGIMVLVNERMIDICSCKVLGLHSKARNQGG
jgi:hypothetical protein